MAVRLSDGNGAQRRDIEVWGNCEAEQWLTDWLDINTPRFTAADRYSTAVNGAFQRIAQGSRTDKLHGLTRYKAHFSQTRCNPVGTRNADDVGLLPGA
jgi:hypothetical protein